MRPISFKRIIELCSLSLKKGFLDVKTISNELQVTDKRSKELLRELSSMNLLKKLNGSYSPKKNTEKLLDFFSKGDWVNINNFFIKNQVFYKNLIKYMKDNSLDKGYTINDLTILLENHTLHYNNASIEIILRWAERFGTVQRNLYTNTFYYINNEEPNIELFINSLLSNYNSLNKKRGLFLSKTFIEIPHLREQVCENLKISRETFDKKFLEYFKKSIGKVELSGAPTITSAKRSPFSIKETNIGYNKDIISPIYDLEKERKGLELMGKMYYFVAIH